MKPIRIYNRMEKWITIFGVGKKEIDSLLTKYGTTGVLQKNDNLDILIEVVHSDWERT